jgi:hypothetical protein
MFVDIKEAKSNIGSIVVYWDSLQKEYKEGKLREVHSDTRYGRVTTKTGRDIDIPLKCIHLGTLDEITNLQEDAEQDDLDLDEDELAKMERDLRLNYDNHAD